MYHYKLRGDRFRIYLCDYADAHLTSSTATNEWYKTKEEASRRVYELNGWKPKTATNEKNSQSSSAY